MAIKPAAAKIVDFETTFDASPAPSSEGDVIWADVRIEYILAGLRPTVTIRLPIAWSAQDAPEERKAQALRCARQLIDHACRVAGVPAVDPAPGVGPMGGAAAPLLEGIAQELGLAEPTTGPAQR
jgi:hypothetical protein